MKEAFRSKILIYSFLVQQEHNQWHYQWDKWVKKHVGNRDGIKQSRRRLVQYKNNPKPHAALSRVCTQLGWLRWKSAVRTACGGLSPRIRLTGGVSVGVQLVVGTSAQHQLVTETRKRRRVTHRLYVRNENVLYDNIVSSQVVMSLSLEKTLLPHSRSSPHWTPCPRGPPGHTEEPCSCDT